MKRFTIAVTVLLALVSIRASAATTKRDVDIKAPDGANLRGTYFSPGQEGPGILLLHECSMDRHAWDGLATDLANAGFNVLTVDFRGKGESDGKTAYLTERDATRQKWTSDVEAMFAYLTAQKGVDKSRLAVGGASCGVEQSTDLAMHHHEIKTILELSGAATDQARTYIGKTPAVAIFGAASKEDTDAAKGIQELLAASKNPHSQVHIYPGNAHGVSTFAANPDLETMVVSWLKERLMVGGGGK